MIPADWEVKQIFQLNSSKDTVKTGPLGSLLHSYDDYTDEDRQSNLKVTMYDDMLEITSPENVMPSTNLENFADNPFETGYRILASILKECRNAVLLNSGKHII